ncbi:MAG: hypothetical protein QOE87_1008, partial [Gaiellales bacterium]|nr:hypothetical protein [Gaiellales bacterium]
ATEVKPDLPNWPRSPTGLGGFDLAIGPSRDSGGTAWPVLAELKWSTGGGDKVGEALWDAFKLAHASALPDVEATYLITGAPSVAWDRSPSGSELFGDARTDTVDLVTRHAKLWRWNRDYGAKDWPQKFPSAIQTRLVDDVTVDTATGEWRILISSVRGVDGWIDAVDGWPQGVEPPPA